MLVRIQWFEKIAVVRWICHGICSEETKTKREKRDNDRSSEVFISFYSPSFHFIYKKRKKMQGDINRNRTMTKGQSLDGKQQFPTVKKGIIKMV